MRLAGILLTGGASSRMGTDKAGLRNQAGETLAARTGRLLAGVAAPCVEVGSGGSGLPPVQESPPGAGPLVAVAAGWEALAPAQPDAAVVVATDLPALSAAVLEWLACYPGRASVVPLAGGFPQPLCARWSAADLDTARLLVAAGRRALRDLVAACVPVFADPGPGPGQAAFTDVDTPAAAQSFGLAVPPR